MAKEYYIKTFGCQMNYSDSERISSILEKNKLKPTDDINQANLIVFNTCGVRQMAEDRVYGQIHNIKKNNPIVKIILTGCLANRKDVQRRLKNKVDLFCEIKDFPKKVASIMYKVSDIRKYVIHNTSKETIAYLSVAPKYKNNFSAYVPIMTGCNNFCSYCVVPYARGREVSRPASEIIKEIKGLIKKGYKEIILLGQNVNSYSYKIQNTRNKAQTKTTNYKLQTTNFINFSQLIKKIDALPGNFWIQFISNHPKDVTNEMIETVAKCKKVCECFHLPIQSGNDAVIKKMNRKYTAKQYLTIIGKIKKAYRKHKPNSLYAITSDIIVGFPGETKKQFLDSAKIMQEAKYDMVFFGQFSPRPETAAWKMKDNISKIEKVRREKYLNEILKKTSFENNQKYISKTLEVLIENEKNGFYFGRTRTGKNVKVYPVESLRSKDVIGVFHRVKITKANIWNLEAEIIK